MPRVRHRRHDFFQHSQLVQPPQQIAQIARATKILNVNAQIEAGRMGESGKAFTVIADEMASLSRDVETTNAMISNLAAMLTQFMPEIESMTNEAVRGANKFSREFETLQRDVVRVEGEMQAQYLGSVKEAERIATHTLEVAYTALSRLQFQDPMAQSLAKIKIECDTMMETVDHADYEIKIESLNAIELAGGEDAYISLLDRFFGFGEPPVKQMGIDPTPDEVRAGYALGRFEGLNNEPDMEAPWAYHWVGRPDRTADDGPDESAVSPKGREECAPWIARAISDRSSSGSGIARPSAFRRMRSPAISGARPS